MINNMKKSRGFSYIEILIAMALFAIALLAIIPAIQQAGRNMIYAQEAYSSHLQAQGIMLVVRDAISNNQPPMAQAVQYASGRFEFSFWANGQWHHSNGDMAVDNPEVNAVMNSSVTSQALIIAAVVWNDDNQIASRAVGVKHSNL